MLVAVSATAVAYTVYTNSSGNHKKPTPPPVKAIVSVNEANAKSGAQNQQKTAVYNSAIPGYSNPVESTR